MPQIEATHNLPAEAARLRQRRQRLIDAFLADGGGEFLKSHSDALDEYFRESFESSMAGPRMDILKNPYAIIALGGYGRREQCIHSDVDLLFLFQKKIPPMAEELIREVVYPLWDLGLEVGYATRSLKEGLSWARQDFEVLTSYLDARFICGVSPLFSRLMEDLRSRVLSRRSDQVIDWLVQRNLERHGKFGDSAYLLEPNLKEGQGGLRDYHTIFWVAKIKYGFKQFRDFEYYGHFSHREFQELLGALRFIWTVRNRLHHLTGRKCDQLYLEYQVELAEALGYRDNGLKPVEQFLSQLHGQMERVKQQHQLFLHALATARRAARPGRKSTRTTPVQGLEVREDTLAFSGSEDIAASPLLLLQIFEESARLGIPLGHEARRLVHEFAHLVDERLVASEAAVRAFERVLCCPDVAFEGLDVMLQTGLLAQLIPEFGGIVNRIQYNEYHLYPVGRHSLKTVQMLKKFGAHGDPDSDIFLFEIFREIPGRRRLFWAALLHDIGKGKPGGHHAESGAQMTRRLLKRFGYRDAEVETVASLVRDHLLLVKTATRRNLNDEETAVACARRIRDLDTLKMLYLLTVADAMATGPKAWNSWTSALLQDLFLKVYRILEEGQLASRRVVRSVDRKKEKLLAACGSEEDRRFIKERLAVMSPRYLLYASVDEIRHHLALAEQLGAADFVWRVARGGDPGTRRVTICAKDRPGLFSRIAGVFTLNGVNILDAQIFTWRNNLALDIFEVKPPPDRIFEQERWQQAENHLREALAGRLDIGARLQSRGPGKVGRPAGLVSVPPKVVVDNEGSSFFTIIEVFSYDFKGLLFRVTDALFRCGLDIWVAKIATKVDQVVDVFYVRDFDGQKIMEPRDVATIKRTLLAVLPSGHQPPAPGGQKSITTGKTAGK